MIEMTAAKGIVQSMILENVEKVFCVPGESFLSVTNEIHDVPSIQLISGRQEGGVAFMAESYAKASGKVGVCFATRGPGATNLSIGLHAAQHDSTPLVAFIGQVDSQFLGREAFQEIDMAEYFKHLVKWTVEIREAIRIPELVRRAFHIAKSGRPGPVLVSLPEDILDEVAKMEFNDNVVVHSNPRPNEYAVKDACELLQNAKTPIIIAGGGIALTRSAYKLIELSERFCIPVVSATRRMDVFPNDHPHYLGTIWSGSPDFLVNAIKNADVVLALGTRLSQGTTLSYSLISSKSKLIHVDISADEINKLYATSLGIVSDVEQFMINIVEELDKINLNEERRKFVLDLGIQFQKYSAPNQIYNERFVDLEGLMYDFTEIFSKDTIITTDAGNYLGWLLKHYHFTEQGTAISPTSGAMGYGLPAAIGAKLAHPNKIVVSFSGDGGFMMTLQEMETAVRYEIPIIAIVANNNMYGTIREHQEKRFPKRIIGTQLSNPDFAEMIRSMGGFGEKVTRNKDFIPAFNSALQSKKPSIIEVLIDPEQISVDNTISSLRLN